MNITENNNLLADFIALEKSSYYSGKDTKGNNLSWAYVFNNEFYTYEELKFDTDWNWLMEVAQQITITKEFHEEYPNNNLFWEAYNQIDKEEIHNSCVEFIKWYNQQKS